MQVLVKCNCGCYCPSAVVQGSMVCCKRHVSVKFGKYSLQKKCNDLLNISYLSSNILGGIFQIDRKIILKSVINSVYHIPEPLTPQSNATD